MNTIVRNDNVHYYTFAVSKNILKYDYT